MNIKLKSKSELSMYKNYVNFLHPVMEVSPQERDVLASLMLEYKNIAKDVNNHEYINKLLFSADTRKKVSENLNMSVLRYDGIITKFRKMKIVQGRSIPKEIIPEIKNGKIVINVIIQLDDKQKV